MDLKKENMQRLSDLLVGPKVRWKACPNCQRRMRRERLADEDALQSYFVCRIEKWLHAHGREMIGWDELLEGGVTPSTIVTAAGI